MAVTWKMLDDFMDDEHGEICQHQDNGLSHQEAMAEQSTLTLAEVQRLLWCTRKYKEMMREYARFFKTHGVKDFAELVERVKTVAGGGYDKTASHQAQTPHTRHSKKHNA